MKHSHTKCTATRLWLSCVGALLLALPGLGQEPLSLEQCRTLALEHNNKVRMAQENAVSARYLQKSARTKYFPEVRFTGGYLHTFDSFKLINGDLFLPVVPPSVIDPVTKGFNPSALADPSVALSTLVINPKTGKPMIGPDGQPIFQKYAMLPGDRFSFRHNDIFIAGFSFTQPIFMGTKILQANNIARSTAAIASENVVLTKAEVLNNTDMAYWRVVSLKEKVKLARAYVSLLETLVTDLGNLNTEGFITKNDLLKAQVKLNEAKLAQVKAENGLQLSCMALAQTLGLSAENLEVADDMATLESITLPAGAGSNNSPVENRAEVQMLLRKLDIAKAGVGLARSRFMPSIALQGGYTMMNPNPYNAFKEEFGGDWSVGLVLTMPLFQSGDRFFTYNAAKSKVQSAQYELNEAKELIALQIQQARFRYNESVKRVELTLLSRKQAEQNMEYSKDNYLEGMLKLTDLLEAQLQWQRASTEYIDALIEVKMALSELDKATGAIYQYPAMGEANKEK